MNERPIFGMTSFGSRHDRKREEFLSALSREPRSITHFIEALRNTANPYHANVMRHYLSSVAWPAHFTVGVNVFLVSQLDYLRDLKPERHSLIVICTEHFDADRQRLGDRLGLSGTTSSRHSNARASSVPKNLTIMSQLRPADAEFVRRCLYPWDTWLHAHICGARGHRAGTR